MKKIVRIAAFYQCEEFETQDVEKEIYTKEKEQFHFFFFHNQQLHFNKEIIKKETLIKDYGNIDPIFTLKNNKLIMTKTINDFDEKEFDKRVNNNYKKYVGNINYRIECIFQTFYIFYDLYNDRSLIYLFPDQLFDKFKKHLAQNDMKYNKIYLNNDFVKYYDTVYWANYFSRINPDTPQEGMVKEKNITRIIQLQG